MILYVNVAFLVHMIRPVGLSVCLTKGILKEDIQETSDFFF